MHYYIYLKLQILPLTLTSEFATFALLNLKFNFVARIKHMTSCQLAAGKRNRNSKINFPWHLKTQLFPFGRYKMDNRQSIKLVLKIKYLKISFK